MRIDLNDRILAAAGEDNPVLAYAVAALVDNGARRDDEARQPDILLVSLPLVAREDFDAAAALAPARRTGAAMAERGEGRILVLLAAAAGVPMRRHPLYSAQMAAAAVGVRAMAMEFGAKVAVNALGIGLVGDPPVSGETAMLSHAPVGRAGALDELRGPVLFLCDPMNSYTTGQLLAVDGGWSAGYGRSF